jgi:hypothetical protein
MPGKKAKHRKGAGKKKNSENGDEQEAMHSFWFHDHRAAFKATHSPSPKLAPGMHRVAARILA